MHWDRTGLLRFRGWLLYDYQLILDVDIANSQGGDFPDSTSGEVEEFRKDRILQGEVGTKVFQLVLGNDWRLPWPIGFAHGGFRSVRSLGVGIWCGGWSTLFPPPSYLIKEREDQVKNQVFMGVSSFLVPLHWFTEPFPWRPLRYATIWFDGKPLVM